MTQSSEPDTVAADKIDKGSLVILNVWAWMAHEKKTDELIADMDRMRKDSPNLYPSMMGWIVILARHRVEIGDIEPPPKPSQGDTT